MHDRYKESTLVEQAFRTCKTAHLETRPIYVRTAEHTRGHVLVVMLAYLIRREPSRAWTSSDITVEEGLHQLQTLSSIEIRVEGGGCLSREWISVPEGAVSEKADIGPCSETRPTRLASEHRSLRCLFPQRVVLGCPGEIRTVERIGFDHILPLHPHRFDFIGVRHQVFDLFGESLVMIEQSVRGV